ncbi:MAG TPA: methionine--tRNA ligase [Myxococcales bacterium]|nr:methionine--tRNA ligase [Myxococcales bacterium]
MSSRILVTHALKYANGALHLGHLVESVQTDVFVRAMNAMGKECIFISASDTHGTPIEISARKAGVPPEEWIEKNHREDAEDYKAFEIDFDLFYTTHSPENELHARHIYEKLDQAGHIAKRSVEQMYCPTDKRFLPDRYIRGTCPVCGTPDQYGDACEKCGSTYQPTDLKNPRCAICGNTALERRASMHYFVKLSDFDEFLRKWTSEDERLQPEIRNYVQKWLGEGLRDWDISRDAPYFGFKIPGEESKYFYVWLDAPVGYLSSTDRWCQDHGRRLDDFWKSNDCEVIHFIGKDIIYFHTLFWPAMLHASGWSVPSRVHVHGMLTVEGAKMSKSRGTFLNAREYLEAGLDPEWLRYFFAANLGPTPSDIDLSLNELKNRVNGELVGNLGNLANRALNILYKNFGGKYRDYKGWAVENFADFENFADQMERETIWPAYGRCDTRLAIQTIMAISSTGNGMMQKFQPWQLLKTDPEAAQKWLTLAVHLARQCGRLIAPVLPTYAKALAEQSGAPLDAPREQWLNSIISQPKPLVRKVEDADIEKLSKRFNAAPEADKAPEAPSISIDEFGKLELRAGKVLACEKVAKKDKLLKLTIDLGEPAPRTIVSGVATSYKPEELVGKVVAVVANLPKKSFGKGLESHGMVLYADGGAREHTAVELPADVKPGSKVK